MTAPGSQLTQYSMTTEELNLLAKLAQLPDTQIKARQVDTFWNNIADKYSVEVESISPAGLIDLRIFMAVPRKPKKLHTIRKV